MTHILSYCQMLKAHLRAIKDLIKEQLQCVTVRKETPMKKGTIVLGSFYYEIMSFVCMMGVKNANQFDNCNYLETTDFSVIS